jgi:small subunit ribosomal protein S7
MRKRQAKKRPLLPDPKFNDQLVTRFVNMMMWDGKKSVAFKVFYDAIDIVEEKKNDEEKNSFGSLERSLIQRYASRRSAQSPGRWCNIPDPYANSS